MSSVVSRNKKRLGGTMAFEEPGSVAYLYEGDKKIAQIKVDTTVVLKT